MTVTEASPEPVPGPGEADPPAVEEARGKVKVPVSQWSRRRQIAQAGKLVRELPWLGKWRCHDGWCGAEASYICADEGKLSCRLDRGTLNAPVALARLGLGPLSPEGGLDDYGDFQGRSAR